MPRPRWPDVICIGATKAGTTSLRRYLRAHPDVHVSRLTEPDYFSYGWAGRDPDAYQALFASDRQVTVDLSTSYSEHPHDALAAERIASTLPAVKLVYLVRHPVERFVSHALYWGWVDGFDPLGDPVAVHNMALTSHYAARLESYLRHVPLERILVLKTDDLDRDGRAVMARVHAFIGVQDRNGDFSTHHNATPDEIRTRPIDAGWVEQQLGDWRADARRLSALTGLDVSDWLA